MTFKRITAFVLTFVLCLVCLPFSCSAADSGTLPGGLSWSCDDEGTLTISGSGYMPDYSSIAAVPWEQYRAVIVRAVISSGVKSIGSYAFLNCTALQTCSIPEGVEVIGEGAFMSCTSLQQLFLPSSLAYLEQGAFFSCSSLSAVHFAGNAPSLDSQCFQGVNCTVYVDCQRSGWNEASQSMYGGTVRWAVHSYNVAEVIASANCTTEGKVKKVCANCGDIIFEAVPATGHKTEHFKKLDEDCSSDGRKEYWRCKVCGDYFLDRSCTVKASEEDLLIPAAHRIITEPALEPTPDKDGYTEYSYCERCKAVFSEKKVIPALGYLCAFPGLSPNDRVNINGTDYVLNANCEAKLPDSCCQIASFCVYNSGTADGNTSSPMWLRVYTLSYDAVSGYTASRCTELDNLLGYAGTSIRTKGDKGIRLVSSIPEAAKYALAGEGIRGFTLLEYGTVTAPRSMVNSGLTLETAGASVLPAYIKGSRDIVSGAGSGSVFFTGEITGISNGQCSELFTFRPYMKLRAPDGRTVAVYGGSVSRSPGYVAWQNRSAFSPGTDPYRYIWSIIHMSFGNAYDAEYIP